MSSSTEFAYKSAEKAFKKTPRNKKTMTAVASKGRWLLIISAFVAAAADDASTSLRRPARDVALAPPGLDLGGGPNPQEAPAPQDAERQDLPQADDEAVPVAGEAGPLVARRLQVVGLEDGWRVHEGVRLNSNRVHQNHGIVSDPWLGVETLSECKRTCLSVTTCLSIDFGKGECFLSTVAGGSELETSGDHSHYVPTRQTLSQELVDEVERLQEEARCFTLGVPFDGTSYSDFGDGADSFLPNCDVSRRTSFDYMFHNGHQGQDTTTTNPDISGWDVSAGGSFYYMFQGARSFNRDLSGWTIRYLYHTHLGYYTEVSGMFEGTSMDNVNKCPCIEWRRRQRSRWCPGKDDLQGNPSTHEEAATRRDLRC